MKKDILVSVVVITYNSEKTILETLDSIYSQTYKNIELIISDDSSKDNTIKVINKWLNEKKERFINVRLLNLEKNVGITKNLNTGLKEARGEYIKTIAGDDILLETCIEDSLRYCLKNNFEIIYSKVIPFTTIPNLKYEKKLIKIEENKISFFNLSLAQQFRELLFHFPITTIGLFISNKLLKEVQYFDERFEMIEDYPFAFKIVSKGYKLNLLDKEEVKYRVRSEEENLKINNSKRVINHRKDLNKFRELIIIPELLKRKMYFEVYNLYIRKIEERLYGSNSKIIVNLGKIIGFLSTRKIVLKYNYYKLKLNGNKKF